MKRIAVIFDMDGVIVDNISYHIEALQIFSNRYNCSFTDYEFKNYISGKTVREVMKYLFKKELSENEIIRYADEKETIYRDIYNTHIKPVAGLMRFLNDLKENSIKTAVATAGPTANVEFVFDRLGIGEYFNAVINGDMVVNGKPHPEIYLKAASKLNIKPSQCIVIEDSLSGIQSGLNAGMTVIGITTVHSKEELSKANYVIKDFTELNIQGLKKRI